MKRKLLLGLVLSVAGCAFLLGCGGSGNSAGSLSTPESPAPAPPPPVVNQSAGGIWEGTTSLSGVTAKTLAFVSQTGQFFSVTINQNNNCADVATGSVITNGGALSGTILDATVLWTTFANVQPDCTYPDGSISGSGTLLGTVTAQSSATLTTTEYTAKGDTLSTTVGPLAFNALYDESSSLSKLAGNWVSSTGVVNSINAEGAGFSEDPATGCIDNSQYSIIDPSYNLYAISATYGDCTGAASILNGLVLNGLVTLDDTVSPHQLVGGATVQLTDGLLLIVVAAGTAD